VGGRWVGSHRPGRGLSLRQTRGPLEHGPSMPEGRGRWSGDHSCLWIAGLVGFRGMVLAEIVQACAGIRSMALWRSCRPVQACGAQSGRAEIMQTCADLRGMARWRS
jgi:hypothetical protein